MKLKITRSSEIIPVSAPVKKLNIMNAGDFLRAQAANWPWKDMPLGKLSIFCGHPGLAVKAAAEVTRDTAHEVIFISSNTQNIDTLTPRLTGAGANLDQILCGNGTGFTLDQHIQVLLETIEANPKVKLVIIDPNAAGLMTYRLFAEKMNIAIVGDFDGIVNLPFDPRGMKGFEWYGRTS